MSSIVSEIPANWAPNSASKRLQHAIRQQAEAAEVGEAGALAEAAEAGDVHTRPHSLEFQAAADRYLGLRRAVPERAALFFDFVADRVGKRPRSWRSRSKPVQLMTKS